MNIDDDRFSPIPTEGLHPRRVQDLDETPIPGVDGIGGSVSIMAYSEDSGLTYEQTEPVGPNYHRYRSSVNPPPIWTRLTS